MRHNIVSRRHFLAGTGAALAMPTILSSGCVCAKGVAARRPLPSERLNVGFIGYGTMAHDNIGNFLNNDQVQVVAIADCNKESGLYGYRAERLGGREPGRRRVNEFYAQKLNRPDYNGCAVFSDFRELLDMGGLDAVVISTPDHWHAIQAIWAARKGKHIYGQKPMSLCIAEGRAMANEVQKAGITFQVGSQQRSDNYFRMACEFVRNGRIGRLQKIIVGLPGGHSLFGKTGADASLEPLPQPPPHIDFDMWLGPARQRPFIPGLHNPLSWRANLDYSGGMITDWGAHHLDIVQWALGMDDSGPVAIENLESDLPPPDAVFNTAANYSFEVVYADGTRVFVSNKNPNGVRFIGEGGKEIFVTRGKLEMKPQELIREKIQENEINLYRSGQHERNFIECVYSGKPTITTCEIGHRSITIAHLANIGLRLGRKQVQWNPKTERFVNDPEADKLLTAPMRGAWTLDMKV
ncbi:MAG TPA: Gfo/Idh/MocA family oxidoreductase [Kiritimatiellia bacterium]|nr:Gfo/Idh/MocA family oxidoreductase [Kiritimatiellia bacterium]HRU71534.1 Gfo/Idh/MocA family oxidoreductase [Kiritimatiellia bacterium]